MAAQARVIAVPQRMAPRASKRSALMFFNARVHKEIRGPIAIGRMALTAGAGGMSGGRRVTVRAGAGDGGVVHGRGFPGRLRVTGGADRAVARAVFN